MIGEFGCYADMDHASCLKWMETGFNEWRKRGYGIDLWHNFRHEDLCAYA